MPSAAPPKLQFARDSRTYGQWFSPAETRNQHRSDTANTKHQHLFSLSAYPMEVKRRRPETDTVVVWDGGHNRPTCPQA